MLYNLQVIVFERFTDGNKLSKRANNTEVEIKDYKSTRYACYLISQTEEKLKKYNIQTE